MKSNGKSVGQALIWIAAAILLFAAQNGRAGVITGSKHDFTGSSWSGGRICVACHTPHKADTTISDAPLWNHTMSSTASYTLYNNSANSLTLNATMGQPGSTSKLCLSCHDGTVAVDSFGGAAGSTMIGTLNARASLGTTLADDHPIGFTYDGSLATADGSLHDPSSKSVTIGTSGQQKTGTIANVLLVAGKMECSSCHDVHNTFTVGTTGLTKVSQAGSALCLSCHNK